ncbi:MAG: hypothetical protein COT73_12990 [Bdellovibrio sp. CG10_big_fil_rev_8_21_14_0_10_47_8]|nr:MAG: hypothetical protein COT73_12990 [Bdellovibrio sp. CG10_big_fil_rev_8_21_14_0_10_47_8]
MEPAPDVVPTPVVQPAPVRPPTPGSPPSVPNHRGAEQPTQGRSDQNQPTPGDRPDRGGRRGGQDQGDNNGRGPSNDSNQRMIAVQKDLNLQEYFRTGFNSAYADAARYFYNVEFQNNIDDGYRAGTEVGSDVGDKVAYMTGQRIGFNRLFLVASGEAYRTSYINSFYDGFQKTYDNYAGRAIVSVSLKRVIESNNNGILEPGEVFATEFTLSNEGGVDADVSISVTGQVSPGAAQVFRIPALQSKVFRADKIGSINGLARSRSQAEINLLASYQGQTLSSSLNQAIFKVVDVVAVRPQIDINRGSGQVVLTLENNSSLRSPGTITARLSLNGVQKDLVAVGVIAANTQAQALVKFSQVDPLDIIAGKIQMGYDVTMNGETLSSVIEPLGAPDVIDAKLSYWDSLWNKQGWAPGGLGEKPKRVARLREEIRVANMQDITSAGRTNIWKSPMQTVVGKAGRHAVAAAANTPLRLAYHSLGVDFYGIRKSIPGGFLGPGNRDDYKDLCNVLAVHGDYDKKPRTPIYAPVFSDY